MNPPPAKSDNLKFPHTLVTKVVDLTLQRFDDLVRSVNRGSELAPFPLPAADAVFFCTSAPLFGVNLVAELAFLMDWNGLHDQFHTARFPRAVLSVAMLSEVAPFPITTGKSMLVVETHFYCFNSPSVAVTSAIEGSAFSYLPMLFVLPCAHWRVLLGSDTCISWAVEKMLRIDTQSSPRETNH